MSKREYRRFTAEQKIEILREAEQPGVTVSEVCRRHSLSPSMIRPREREALIRLHRDWVSFWLKGEERPGAEDQYRRWRKFKESN